MIKRILALCMVVCMLLVAPMGVQAVDTSHFVGQQLYLGDSLTMLFCAELTQRHIENGVMTITVGEELYDSYILADTPPLDGGVYAFYVDLGAAQMAQDITFTLTVSNRVALQQTFSVRDYAQYLLDNNYDQQTTSLILEMLNYGAKAQLHFGISRDDLANAGNELQSHAQIPAEIPEIVIDGEVDGVSYHGGSVLFQSRLGMRYYFNITADADAYTFMVDGEIYKPIRKGNLHYIEVNGIMPYDYDEPMTVAVTDGENTMSLEYSPVHYFSRMYHNDRSSREFKDMLAAAYGYLQAAKVYTEGEETPDTPSEGYDGSEVTIKFAHTMGAKLQSVLDYHIGEFNKLYPNIHIEHSSYGGWADIDDLINVEIRGDLQPNLAFCYPEHVAIYNMASATVSLDDLIANKALITRADGTKETMGLTDDEINDLKAGGFYEEGKVYGDGLMYTLPVCKSTDVLYYNKTFFEANGLSVPTTWDEMAETCQKILQIDPTCIPLGYDSESNLFINLCQQYGYDYTSTTGERFLFNNDDCKRFVKQFRDWYQAGYITTINLCGMYTSSLFIESDKTNPHCYMSVASSGGASYQVPYDGEFEVGIASIPQVNPANPKVISQGPSLCILKGSTTTDQEILASWLFMKYLVTNVSFQTEYSSAAGYMPVIASARNNELYQAWLDNADGYFQVTALAIKTALENLEAYFVPPAFNGTSIARNEVGELMVHCMSTETNDVDELIDKAFDDAYNECIYQAG